MKLGSEVICTISGYKNLKSWDKDSNESGKKLSAMEPGPTNTYLQGPFFTVKVQLVIQGISASV